MDAPQIIAGRFRVEREIGRGGMGTVYRAMHLVLARPVAIKILKEEFANYPEVTERFMREARTMARLRHPRAAIIFDAGRLEDGRPFIVMEYVEGETLAVRLAREGRFTPEAAVKIAVEICDVLAEAHRLGIVHRDLKPSNILMSERGVCVLDFGIAKILATASDDATTRTHFTTGSGAIIGTPRYMSPEQCLGHKVSTGSDLYSVGVLLYEMLAGRPPFVDALASAVLVKQATKLPPPLPTLRDDIPPPLTTAVHTLLAKRPEQRPKTAALAGALLQRSIIRPPAQRAGVETAMPLASTISILSSNRRAAARTVAALALLTMCGALFFAWAQNSLKTSGSEGAIDSSARGRDSASPNPAQTSAPPLTPDTARRIADSVLRATINDARIVRVRRGESAIAAVHNGRGVGASQLYLIQKRKGSYRVTERMSLDADRAARGLRWTTEVVDADGDGSEEVICTGTNTKGNSHDAQRFILYVPRTGKTYSLQLAPDKKESNVLNAQWSPNALSPRAARYRSILRQRAESSLSTL
ncbi:MAG: serine/threonine protein kinase [Pyrinomonadaceae bacterium]|nr:serine/threonine protein kinase [Pyrinomonadaceae bacterium]